MKVKITNIPVTSFATITVEVEELTQEALQHAVRAVSQKELIEGHDKGEIQLDTNLLDGGWELVTEGA